ncbi:MAG: hypothetical protein R2731_15095 [Nocardioides sp.]
MIDLQPGVRVAGEPVQPGLPRGGIDDPVAVAELGRRPAPAVGRRRAAQHGHGDLRAEAGGQPEGVLDRVVPARGQVQPPELGIGLAVVRHPGHHAGLEGLDGEDVLDSRTHGMPREPLGVGDDDPVGDIAEGRAQGMDLRGSAAAAGRGVGLVGDEDRLRGDLGAANAVPLRLAHHGLHDSRDVLDVEPSAVEGAVGGHGPQDLADRLDAALARRLRGLDDERRGAHPDDHAVPAPVERRRRILHALVRGGRAAGEEPRPDPGHHPLAGGVVGRHHDHAPAAPGPDPVLGDRQRLRRARTGRVDLGVRTAGADQLGELGVPHRQHAEQEPPVEGVRVGVTLGAHLGQQSVDLGQRRAALVELRPDRFESQDLLAASAVERVVLHRLHEALVAGEGRGEHDPGVVAQRLGQTLSDPAAGCRAWWSCSRA